MSYNWTHVAGIIRINSPRYIGKNVEDLKKIIGREVSREEAYAALYEGENITRSEERRVGKECSEPCRSRWSPYH